MMNLSGDFSLIPRGLRGRVGGCVLLALLAACGGGGGSSATDTATTVTDSSGSATPPSSTSSGIRQRLDACPRATASAAADAYRCLVGNYAGKNIFDGSACSLDIASDGTVSFSSGSVSGAFGLPYAATQYNKVAYTVIPGTSSTGYALLWLASAVAPSASSGERPAQVYFKFNASYDDQLVIDFTPKHDAATSGQAVSCELAVP